MNRRDHGADYRVIRDAVGKANRDAVGKVHVDRNKFFYRTMNKMADDAMKARPTKAANFSFGVSESPPNMLLALVSIMVLTAQGMMPFPKKKMPKLSKNSVETTLRFTFFPCFWAFS
jgi:hypothetical protein